MSLIFIGTMVRERSSTYPKNELLEYEDFGVITHVNRETGEKVLVKIMNLSDTTSKQQYENQLDIQYRMRSAQHILHTHDSFCVTNRGYIITPCLPHTLLSRSKMIFSILEVKNIFYGVCKAIKDLHQSHIAHLDLRADNIWLTDDDEVKLGDFGNSFAWKDCEQHYEMIGSDYYMAPEVRLFEHGYASTQADIWNLGIILCVLTTGLFPYGGTTDEEILQNYCSGTITLPPIKLVSPDDYLFFDLIWKLLCKIPSMRPTIFEVLRHPWFRTPTNQY